MNIQESDLNSTCFIPSPSGIMEDRNLSLQNQTFQMFNESYPANNFTEPGNVILSGLDRDIYVITWPIISSLGIVGNILSFVIMFQLSNSSSFYLYLATLALSDAAVLTIGGLFRWVKMSLLNFVSTEQIICTVPHGFMHTFSFLSSWITVAVTIDRYVAVCHPFQVRNYCTRKNALIFISVALLVIVAVGFPSICLEWKHDYSSCVLPNFATDYCLRYLNYIKMYGSILVPFCLIAIFNTLIIRGIYKAATTRSTLTTENTNGTPGIKDSTKRTIVMLFTITVFFMVCFLPFVFASLYGQFTDRSWIQFKENNPIGDTIVNLVILINHSFNFVLYCFSGQRFRDRIVAMFCCRCTRSN